MTPQEAQDAVYGEFRAAFEAWHFQSEGSCQTGVQPTSVPTDVAPEVTPKEAARDALQRAFDRRD